MQRSSLPREGYGRPWLPPRAVQGSTRSVEPSPFSSRPPYPHGRRFGRRRHQGDPATTRRYRNLSPPLRVIASANGPANVCNLAALATCWMGSSLECFPVHNSSSLVDTAVWDVSSSCSPSPASYWPAAGLPSAATAPLFTLSVTGGRALCSLDAHRAEPCSPRYGLRRGHALTVRARTGHGGQSTHAAVARIADQLHRRPGGVLARPAPCSTMLAQISRSRPAKP